MSAYLEIVRAGNEDEPVGPDQATLSRQSDITELKVRQEVTQDRSQIGVVVVPFKAEHIGLSHPDVSVTILYILVLVYVFVLQLEVERQDS